MTILLGFLLMMQQSTMVQNTCPDLSGRYVIQGEDGRVYVTVKQTRCERITIEWLIHSHPDTSRTTHALPLDGKFHTDTDWFGERGQRLTSAQFRSDTLRSFQNRLRREALPRLGGNCRSRFSRTMTFAPSFFDPYGTARSATRAGRQKSNTRAAEDEAAQRSEKGC